MAKQYEDTQTKQADMASTENQVLGSIVFL